MKKIFIVILLTLIYVHTPMSALALTATSSASPTDKPASAALLNQINNLKDKIASKVAQLKLVEKRGIIGTVTEVSSTQITINDLQNQTRFVDVDEITKFSNDSAKSGFGISDVTKGMNISVLGLYNKESRRILARFVDVISFPAYIVGHVTQVDKANYTITVENTEKKTFLIDIESLTKMNSYSVDNTEPVRTGFSKITGGEKVLIIGTIDSKDKNRVSGDRILLFPDFGGSAASLDKDGTPSPSPSGTKNVTPTTSALTPTRKPTLVP